MNRVIKRSGIALTALGVSALFQASNQPANLQQPSGPNALTPQALSQIQSAHGWPARVAIEVISAFDTNVDTFSATSSATTPTTPTTPTNTNTTATTPLTNISLVADAATPAPQCTGSENSGGCYTPATPGPNPFVSPEPCISIALPFIAGGDKCIANDGEGGAIIHYVTDGMKVLSGAIGGIIVLMIVIAGVQYIISLGNPTGIAAAKKRLTNAIIALILFIMAFAIVNFLIPGGIIQ